MKKLCITITLTVVAVGVIGAAALGTGATSITVIGTPGDLAVGHFRQQLTGASTFTVAGANVQVYGRYRGLNASQAYFTVGYGNLNCDPAQAFPVGPFTTNDHGRAVLAASVALPAIVDVGLTGSMSVRRGGDDTDIDDDRLTGPTDVVAVPGIPSIGLIECDQHPYVLNLN